MNKKSEYQNRSNQALDILDSPNNDSPALATVPADSDSSMDEETRVA